MAVGGKVRGDSSVGSVGSSSALDSSLSADVGDLALFDIKLLGLGVGLEVFEERDDVVNRLGRESSVVMVEVLAHGLSAGTSGVPSEGDDSFVLESPLHVLDGLEQVESSAGSSSLISVLVVNSQVIDLALSAYAKRRVSGEWRQDGEKQEQGAASYFWLAQRVVWNT